MTNTLNKKISVIILFLVISLVFSACGARIAITDGSETEPDDFSETEATASDTEPAQITTDIEDTTTETYEESSENTSAAVTETETTASEAEKTTTAAETTTTEKATAATNNAPTDITKAEGKVIAFTFDDGPGNSEATKIILDKLESLNMKATFFLAGHKITNSSKQNLQRMLELGCDIGNHSYSHPSFTNMSLSAIKEELNKTNDIIYNLIGYKPYLMRPPYGNLPAEYLGKLDMNIICWDVDTMDWDFYSKNYKSKSMEEIADMVYDYSLTKIYSSSKIILMHEIYTSSALAFCKLADKLVADGYTLVTISELLGSENLKNTSIKFGFQWPKNS